MYFAHTNPREGIFELIRKQTVPFIFALELIPRKKFPFLGIVGELRQICRAGIYAAEKIEGEGNFPTITLLHAFML